MAPLKPEAQARRAAAAQEVTAVLNGDRRAAELLTALAKGLFLRVANQDQWDWFATSRTLGYASDRLHRFILGASVDMASAAANAG